MEFPRFINDTYYMPDQTKWPTVSEVKIPAGVVCDAPTTTYREPINVRRQLILKPLSLRMRIRWWFLRAFRTRKYRQIEEKIEQWQKETVRRIEHALIFGTETDGPTNKEQP